MSKLLKLAVIGLFSGLVLSTASLTSASAADGCGGGKYRGPGGACHRIGYGPAFGNFYGPGPSPYLYTGRCWRGPYGAWHCR